MIVRYLDESVDWQTDEIDRRVDERMEEWANGRSDGGMDGWHKRALKKEREPAMLWRNGV